MSTQKLTNKFNDWIAESVHHPGEFQRTKANLLTTFDSKSIFRKPTL